MKRFEVWVADFDPSTGSEMRKKRPAVIIGPKEMNQAYSRMTIIAPLTSTIKNYPTRVPTTFENQGGEIALDQMRSIDKTRLIKKIGLISNEEAKDVCDLLAVMFIYED